MKPLTRPGTKYVKGIPNGERLVSMINFKDKIYVATEKAVYVLISDEFKPVHFVYKPTTKQGGKNEH